MSAGWNWRVIKVGQCDAWPTQQGRQEPCATDSATSRCAPATQHDWEDPLEWPAGTLVGRCLSKITCLTRLFEHFLTSHV
ncbi:hypothetical protein PCASD_12518 [Puccinia coronata f. sp. avenae]|uniref:Uncharacterized protein n=1 Tax=Puccinia coronata f. sp. avenae TaxID=200324 RepID=A0A2N5U7K4_9BASI|nr:hypothetical protein PCASD_12518 [Puccinia coronata f. sp. avenae]